MNNLIKEAEEAAQTAKNAALKAIRQLVWGKTARKKVDIGEFDLTLPSEPHKAFRVNEVNQYGQFFGQVYVDQVDIMDGGVYRIKEEEDAEDYWTPNWNEFHAEQLIALAQHIESNGK